MQTVSLLAGADSKAWEIEETEWKLATRNSLKGEKRAPQCELIFSWFLFILQILHSNRATSRFVCAHLAVRSVPPSGTSQRETLRLPVRLPVWFGIVRYLAHA